jgi:hypothetical protein
LAGWIGITGVTEVSDHDDLDEVGEETSLDLLENEDRRILAISGGMASRSGTAVVDEADYGNRAKLLVRHFAVREAALMDVAAGLRRVPELAEVGDRLTGHVAERRRHMDAVEKMSRSIQGLYLNMGQDFDGALSALLDLVGPGIEWDLEEAIPTIRRTLDRDRRVDLFRSAGYVSRHAPTHLDPDGPKWWERAPVVSRLVTVYQHLRDYPRATRDART